MIPRKWKPGFWRCLIRNAGNLCPSKRGGLGKGIHGKITSASLRVLSRSWPDRSAVGQSPEDVFLRIGSSRLWVCADLPADPKLYLFSDPDQLFSSPQCEIIKDQKKIKVGRVRLEIGGKARRMHLKSYNVFSRRYQLVSLFFPSAAFRSWVGAKILLGAGFHTGRPIAVVEHRSRGVLAKSFYLSEEIPGGKTVDVYWSEELIPISGSEGFLRRRIFLKDLAVLFRSLHGRNIYHNDQGCQYHRRLW